MLHSFLIAILGLQNMRTTNQKARGESGHELEDWLEAERHFEQQTVLFQSGDYYSLSI